MDKSWNKNSLILKSLENNLTITVSAALQKPREEATSRISGSEQAILYGKKGNDLMVDSNEIFC